jgi:hypothetical protein
MGDFVVGMWDGMVRQFEMSKLMWSMMPGKGERALVVATGKALSSPMSKVSSKEKAIWTVRSIRALATERLLTHNMASALLPMPPPSEAKSRRMVAGPGGNGSGEVIVVILRSK